MEDARRKRLHAQLLHTRDELVRQGDIRVDPNREDPSSVRTDEDAQPLNEMNQAIASRRNAERTARLRHIEAALARLRSDPADFGLCEACEEDIADKRMDVMPWARFCLRCQEKRDPERGSARSNLTDYV